MAVLRDIALAREQTLNTKEDRPPRYRAVIVEQRDSSGKDAVYVEGRVFPFYLWVRMWNSGGSVLPAFNADNVPAMAGMLVSVTRSRGSDQELEIVGIDKEALQVADLPVGFSNIGQHGWAHEMPDGAPGFDPVTVYPRSWSQLKAYSSDPLSLVVNVSPFRYYIGSASVSFDGGVVDLTAVVGALAANQARLVLIYLDRSTNTLGTTNGAVGTIAAGWFLGEPAMTTATYSIAVVRIYNGQTEIGESDIRDRRMFLGDAAADATTGGGIANQIAYWTGALTLGGDTGLTYDPATDELTVAGDVYPSGDEAGIHHREANCFNLWNEHFDVAAIPAGWAWAGAPFVVPGTVDWAAVPSVLKVTAISNWVDTRSFLYRTVINADTYAMVGMAVNQVNSGIGIRLDDGSDNNYVEFRIYYSAAGPPETWQFQLVWRTGGGAVNTSVGSTIYIPNPMFIQLYCNGTLWTNWNIHGYVKGLGFGGLSALKQATQAGFTFTPTRRGLIYRNAGPSYDVYYCDAFTPN